MRRPKNPFPTLDFIFDQVRDRFIEQWWIVASGPILLTILLKWWIFLNWWSILHWNSWYYIQIFQNDDRFSLIMINLRTSKCITLPLNEVIWKYLLAPCFTYISWEVGYSPAIITCALRWRRVSCWKNAFLMSFVVDIWLYLLKSIFIKFSGSLFFGLQGPLRAPWFVIVSVSAPKFFTTAALIVVR